MYTIEKKVPQLQVPIDPAAYLDAYEAATEDMLADEDEGHGALILDARDRQHLKSWPYLLRDDGQIHPRWEQTSEWGRVTAVNPPVIGLPRALRSAVQEPGRYILSCDYRACHPYILSRLSEDEAMANDLETDGLYTWLAETLTQAGGSPETARPTAKRLVMATLNGAGDAMLLDLWSKCTGVPPDGRVVDLLRARWPAAMEMHAKIGESLRRKNYCWDVDGHHHEPIHTRKKDLWPAKATGLFLQSLEAAAMRRVLGQLRTQRAPDGGSPVPGWCPGPKGNLDARMVLCLYDETVWSVAPPVLDEAAVAVRYLMAEALQHVLSSGEGGPPDALMIARMTKVTYGSTWAPADQQEIV